MADLNSSIKAALIALFLTAVCITSFASFDGLIKSFCDLKNDAGNVWGILHPGEFIFFCVNPSDGFEIQANTASCVVDYVTFKKG